MKKLAFILLGCAVLLFAASLGIRYVQSAEFERTATEFGLGVPISVSLSGTGSMYPTFPKGKGKTPRELSRETVATVSMYEYPTGFLLLGNRYFVYPLQRGDLVSFENERTKKITTEQSGEAHSLLKRIYALPGDVIELRDGIAYLNNEPQKEPYIARARSTFGGEFLHDCTQITVPEGHVFVMGDNRKGSFDSRSELGFVSFSDIFAVIPFAKQQGKYDSNWRDTALDLNEDGKIHLDKQALLAEINRMRAESGLKPLSYNLKLERSAERRGEVMLRNNDISAEATRSGYTMEKSMKDVRYSNTTWGEFPLLGYYENEEYTDALAEYPKLKRIFVDEDFQDIGIAEVDYVVNNCPQHIIVTQFGGYVPPNYTQEHISSWKNALESLQRVYPGWQQLLSSGDFYEENKSDIDRLLFLMNLRIQNISGIVERMEANRWLTEEQREYIEKDRAYGEEQVQLSDKINRAI